MEIKQNVPDPPILKARRFNDLKVWKDAHTLTVEIYRTTKEFPKHEEYGLSSQIRRAASSIGANIAEGFGRFHFKDKARFYQNSRGSAVETENHAYLARDLGYISDEQCDKIIFNLEEILREINGLINSMNDRASNA